MAEETRSKVWRVIAIFREEVSEKEALDLLSRPGGEVTFAIETPMGPVPFGGQKPFTATTKALVKEAVKAPQREREEPLEARKLIEVEAAEATRLASEFVKELVELRVPLTSAWLFGWPLFEERSLAVLDVHIRLGGGLTAERDSEARRAVEGLSHKWESAKGVLIAPTYYRDSGPPPKPSKQIYP